MAEIQPANSTNAPAGKTRSPMERVLVWGLIGVLAVAAGFEFISKSSHQTALKKLQDKIDAVDKDPSHPEVTENDVKEAAAGKKPSSTKDYEPGTRAANGAKRVEVYSWFTLNPMSKREMWVYYGGKGKDANEPATVLQITEADVSFMPEPAVAQSSDSGQEGGPAAGGPAAGGPGAGGPGGRGGPPPGMMGGQGAAMHAAAGGGRQGRPAADKPDDSTAPADADKDADKADAKPTEDDKPAADKTAEEKAEEKSADKSEEKSE